MSPTLSERPCQDGAVTRLKDTISGGSWGTKAEWINMLGHLFPQAQPQTLPGMSS